MGKLIKFQYGILTWFNLVISRLTVILKGYCLGHRGQEDFGI